MKRMYRCASVFALAGLLYSGEGFAQNKNLNFSEMRDGVVMTKGQVMKIENGQASRIDDAVTLRDGTRVQADGTVVKADGTRQRLREGRAVNERGHLVSARHDMMSYQAILQHENRKLGEKASPLAKAIGQGDTYALERVGRFGGFEGAPAYQNYMTEEQTQQFRQAEQQSTAFHQQIQAADQKIELLDQLLDLTNQRLSLMENNLQANRRINLPEGLARIDQEINQVEARLNDLEQSSANMLTQYQDRSFYQERMTRQGGYDGMQRQDFAMGQEGMEYGQQQYEMVEQQSIASQTRMQMMEEKFDLFNELMDLTEQRLQMMESKLNAHRRITLPEGINQIDQQLEQVEERLKEAERNSSEMMRNQPSGQPYGEQRTTSPDHNNQAIPTRE